MKTRSIKTLLVIISLLSTIQFAFAAGTSNIPPNHIPPMETDTFGFNRAKTHWDIVKLEFSPYLLKSQTAGKKLLTITPTFQYKSNGSTTHFQDSYLWGINCGVFAPGEPSPTLLFWKDTDFLTNNPNGVTVKSGDKITISVNVEFDENVAKAMQNNGLPMQCGLGFIKPIGYQDILTGLAPGLSMDYLLKLNGNNWQINGI